LATRTGAPSPWRTSSASRPEPLYTYDALETAAPGLRQLHRTYVPLSVLVDTKYETEAPPPAPQLYAALNDLGHELRFTEYLRPRMPLPDQAQALRLPEGIPLLTILRVTYTLADKPLALEELHLPGDDLELSYPSDPPRGPNFLYSIQAGSLRSPLQPSQRACRAHRDQLHVLGEGKHPDLTLRVRTNPCSSTLMRSTVLSSTPNRTDDEVNPRSGNAA
jgi:hypothetical protein